ncbi:MAG: heme-dependent peroxidase [Gemmatimonadota bacterium]|nr:heme-dependent peroxidase [Gemmatimonadota bacterium]
MTDAPAPAPRAHPPETTEGWYVLHQILSFDRPLMRAMLGAHNADVRSTAACALEAVVAPSTDGWSAIVPLIGSRGDVMLIHFRASLDDIGVAQQTVAKLTLFDAIRPVYSFLSITEAGLYHASAQLAAEAEARGGKVGDDDHRVAMDERVEKERASQHVQRRLFPRQPDNMPYVCFYPMSKRRAVGQNWYALSLEERSRLMMAHGKTGRTYAGKVSQVISGAIGFDAWEWGVTLFADDPLSFKKIVADMRFDEVSAQYAEFGEFYVGKSMNAAEWLSSLG